MSEATPTDTTSNQQTIIEPLFEALFESTSDAALLLDESGRYVRANRRASALLGYSEAELRRLRPANIISTDTDPEDVAHDSAAMRAGLIVTRRYTLRHKDGHPVPVEITTRRVDQNGAYFLGVARDLSELVTAEQERRRAAAAVAALAEERGAVLASLHEGVVVFGADRRLRDANDAARRLTGADLGAGMTVEEYCAHIVPHDLQGRLLRPDEILPPQASAQGESVKEIVIGAGADERIMLCRFTPLRGQTADDAGIGIICIMRDVTHERAQAQTQAAFAGAIVHELRTPLTSLVGFLDLMLINWAASTDERRRLQVSKAQQAAVRVRGLLEDMLMIARLDAGVVPVQADGVPLAPLARDAAAWLRHAYPGQRVHIRGTAGLAAQADRNLLLQVLSNLLDNAAKYSSEGKPVHIEGEADGSDILIRVIDQGVGIAVTDLPRVFHRFVQPNKAARSGHGGTGLGLSICRPLVEAMGGRISVESTVGAGSVFTVRLPRAGASRTAVPEEHTTTGTPIVAISTLIRSEIERASSSGNPITVLAMSITGIGASAGSDGLPEASYSDDERERINGALRSALRLRDHLGHAGHAGANTFLAVLPGIGGSGAATVTERLRAAVAMIARTPGGAATRHLVIGTATYPDDAATAAELIALAESRRAEAVAAPKQAAAEPRPTPAELPAYFAIAISHELRTPLTTILGSAEAVLHAWVRLDNAARRKGVERVLSGARRLDLLVRDLLLVTGLEEGDLVVRLRRAELAPLLEQAIYDASAAHPNLDVRGRGLRSAPAVWADPDRVEQIIGHLLDNAARHGQGAGPPEVRVEMHVGDVEIRVTDRGPGLPRGGRERLFTRFGKLSQASHAGRVGTGLGLYICRRLVEQMGGAIGVESTPGKGASFWFTLPLADGGGVGDR